VSPELRVQPPVPRQPLALLSDLALPPGLSAF